MNKYELAKKITQLEGLTSEEKASLVELLRSQKKYGLVWEDKPEEIETRLVDELPVLTEVPERAIVSELPMRPTISLSKVTTLKRSPLSLILTRARLT